MNNFYDVKKFFLVYKASLGNKYSLIICKKVFMILISKNFFTCGSNNIFKNLMKTLTGISDLHKTYNKAKFLYTNTLFSLY